MKQPARFALFCALFGLFFAQKLPAQLADDFSDGNFTASPAWSGDAANFKINATGQLQLNAPTGGNSQLAVPLAVPDSAIWEVFFRLDFDPSAQNQLRIYLMADGADLAAASGYFVEIGETGSPDALRFFRQDAGAATLLAAGQAGTVAVSPTGRLRAKRSFSGTWTLSFAPAATGVFEPQCSVNDAALLPGAGRLFGFRCLYTDTRKDKFAFDDVSVRADLPDVSPPKLLAVEASDARTLAISFDETLDPASANDVSNYLISNGIGQLLSAVFDASQPRLVRLALADDLLPAQDYTLTIAGVADLAGNEIGMASLIFRYAQPAAPGEFDLQITEIMADPAPTVGLPEVEWLEIFNRSPTQTFALADVRLADANSAPLPLPVAELAPNQRVVLCATASAPLLLGLPNVLAMPNFPSLNNDADVLTLTDASGNALDRVAYSSAWHEAAKRDGGWSLERINPAQPCLGDANWRSCRTVPGGTPGAPNSVEDTAFVDAAPPLALGIFPIGTQKLRLEFNKWLDREAARPENFRLEPPRTVVAAALENGDRTRVLLTLAEPLPPSILHEILLEPAVRDCNGAPFSSHEPLLVVLPEMPENQDVVLNELLFDPAPGGARYLEIFNRSQKFFDLSEFQIASTTEGLTAVSQVSAQRLMPPGAHFVFSENPTEVAAQFWVENPQHLLANDLPPLADESGAVALYWSKNGASRLVDSLAYSAEMHNPLLPPAGREGVALERVRADGATNAPENWASAAPQHGRAPGSPTAPNSQAKPSAEPPEGALISLVSKRLSPNGDGQEDFLEMAYHLPAPGFAATLTIFDSEGAPVKRLVRQSLIGTEGTLRWDGDMDDGTAARPGIYALFFEVFAPDGAVHRLKRAVVVVF